MRSYQLFFVLVTTVISVQCYAQGEAITHPSVMYTMPEESDRHEGTWLQWPHHHQYGYAYRNSLDPTWIAMTAALVESEKVHIIAYNARERARITTFLEASGVPMDRVDFYLYETDDTWVRDNGPVFVTDHQGQLVIQDWGFNGWGRKSDPYTGLPIAYEKCDQIPARIAKDQGRPLVDLNDIMTNEGGSIEIDGHGTLMACKSSILNDNRNPGMTQDQAEQVFIKYLGVTHFIWLEGRPGADITDQHIDGFARFAQPNTIVTMAPADLIDFDVKSSDVDRLYAAVNKEGVRYDIITLPMTMFDVRTTDGASLGYKGTYLNYYIANTKVLAPMYNDPNDRVAHDILQSLYPSREVVGIDVRDLYSYGGMIHCVTQQQPAK